MKSILTMVMRFWVAAAICLWQQAGAQEISTYREMCEASAGVAVGPDHFVVASDERNKLRIYRRGQPRPVGALDLSKFLDTKEDEGSDLEGAAMIGTRIYWITSHSLNKEGEVRERRHRFFATEVRPGQTPSLGIVGKRPYPDLLGDLVAAKKLDALNLADAAKLKPEERGGLNIEGLAATPEGYLLIGFRNPIPDGLALVVPVKNPRQVVKGKKPKFGKPIRLDLDSRGIRSIERVGSGYLIVAGPPDNDGSFALYRWSGMDHEAPKELRGIDLQGLHPEALFAIPQTNMVQVLSDDGGVKTAGIDCKDQPDESKQSFRSVTITL